MLNKIKKLFGYSTIDLEPMPCTECGANVWSRVHERKFCIDETLAYFTYPGAWRCCTCGAIYGQEVFNETDK